MISPNLNVQIDKTQILEERAARVFDKNARYLNDKGYGFICCLFSSIAYSVSFSMLRLMTDYKTVSSDWTLCVKELVLVLGSLFFIFVLRRRGRYRIPPIKILAIIVVGAIFCELVGARYHLVAYATIGLALTSPLIQAFQIIGTTVLGILWFNEKISSLKVATILLLIIAVSFLNFGQKPSADSSNEIEAPPATASEFSEPRTEVQADSARPEESQSFVDKDVETTTETADVSDDVRRQETTENARTSEKLRSSDSISGEKSRLSVLYWGLFATLITGFGYTMHIVVLRGVLKNKTTAEVAATKGESPISRFSASNVLSSVDRSRSSQDDETGDFSNNVIKADVLTNCDASVFANNQDRSRQWTVMFLLPLVGVVVFACFLFADRGFEGFYDVPKFCWTVVVISGITNMIGFFFQLESLRFVSGSIVSLVAVSQTLALTLIGVAFFAEPSNIFVWVGVVLTLIGVALTGKTE